MERYGLIDTPWGPVALVARGRKLAASSLPGDSRKTVEADILSVFPNAQRDDAVLPELQDAVLAYFAGERVAFPTPLVLDGLTPFGCDVIRACRKIRYGQTCTYGELATRAGHPGASRAVGSVMARNRHPLIVPCHRVVAAGNKLGGFSAPQGVSLKQRLLEWESSA